MSSSIVRVRDVPSPRTYERVQQVVAPRTKVHLLRAELAQMARRGEIREAFDWRESSTHVAVKVVRLRDPRPRPKWAAPAAVALSLLAVGGLGVAVWHSRYVLMLVAGVALLVLAGVKLARRGMRPAQCRCLIHRH